MSESVESPWYKPESKTLELSIDVFSNGQVQSKLRLCQLLEDLQQKGVINKPATLWLLASWCGLLGFMLSVRENLEVSRWLFIDKDTQAIKNTMNINENWVVRQGNLYGITADIETLDFKKISHDFFAPDLVVNTSCEHFKNENWFGHLPQGTVVALQATNMQIPDHVGDIQSLAQMKSKLPLSEVYVEDVLSFSYSNGFEFDRFTLIGKK